MGLKVILHTPTSDCDCSGHSCLVRAMGNNTSEQIKGAHQNAMYTAASHADYAKSSMNKENIAANYNDWRSSFGEYLKSAFGQHPLTIECLSHEVMTMKTHAAEHMLHQGMNVNEPIDMQGHTVLDAFMVAHQDNLVQVGKLHCSAEEKSTIFLAVEDKAFAMMDILKEFGAQASASGSERPAYVA